MTLLVVRKKIKVNSYQVMMMMDDDDEISSTPTTTLEVVKQQLLKLGSLKFIWDSTILKELAGELPRQLTLIFQ